MLKEIVSLLALLPLISCDIGGSDGYEDLHRAIYYRSKNDVIRTLNNARGTPSFMKLLESKIIHDHTPLISAISNGKVNIAKVLLKEGANVNAEDKFMLTPLHHTINCQDRDVLILLRMMLLAGANIDAVGYLGMTPLIMACKEGKEDLAMEFLKNGAKVHYEDSSSRSALHYAAEKGLKSLVDVLLQKGAKLKQRGRKVTPSQCALRNGHKDVAFILRVFASKKADLEEKNEDEYTPLITAVKNGMENCAKAFLAMGADPNGKDKQLSTPMHWAVIAGVPGSLDSLFRHGSDPNVRNTNGKSPLDLAIAKIPKKRSNPVVNSKTLKGSSAFTLIEAGVDVPADNVEYVMKYLLDRQPDFDIPFDDFIMKLSTNYSNRVTRYAFASSRKHNIQLERLVKHYEEVKNFALYRILKPWLSKRGIKYVSDLESLKFVIYDELMYEIFKNTYMEKLPLELVSDTLNFAGEYYKWKLEGIAWNVALASRFLSADLKDAKAVAKQLSRNLI